MYLLRAAKDSQAHVWKDIHEWKKIIVNRLHIGQEMQKNKV